MYEDKAYRAFQVRKAAKLRRPSLDCGHAGDAYQHVWCDRLACAECADLEHDCAAYGGVKSGTEEAPERAEAAPEPPLVPLSSPTWFPIADVASGPSAGTTVAVDVRRAVQDGGAPISDRAGDAFRAETLRQGRTECEVDGRGWRYRNGQWVPAEQYLRELRQQNADSAAAIARMLDETERVLGHIKQLPKPRSPWWKRLLP